MRESDITLDWLTARVREDEDGCWIWTGYSAQGKFPQVRIEGSIKPVRRLLWKVLKQKKSLPSTVQVGCRCKKDACVHPDHLTARTRATLQKGYRLPTEVKAKISRTKRATSELPQELAEKAVLMPGTAKEVAAELNVSKYWVNAVRSRRIRKNYSSPWAGLGA